MRLEGFAGSENAVGMALPGDGWPTHHADRWSYGATGLLTAPRDAAMLVLVNDGAFFGRRQFDMGNVALRMGKGLRIAKEDWNDC